MDKRKCWRLRLLAFLLAAVLLAGSAVQLAPTPTQAASSSEIQAQIDGLKEENDAIQDQIQSLEGQIADNLTQMEALVAQKDALDQQVFLLKEQASNIEAQITAYNLLIADKQDELDIAQQRLDTLTEQNQSRIRAMEMYGSLSYWSVLAQASSFGQLLDRLSMVAEIAQADRRRLQSLRDAADAVAQAQEALAEEKASAQSVRLQLLQNQQALTEKTGQVLEVLNRLGATGLEYERYLAEKEAEQDALMEQIAQAEKAYTEAKRQEYLQWLSTSVAPSTTTGSGGSQPPNQGSGNAVWTMPIRYTRFSSAYGMREHPLEGVPKFHHGVDLAAPEGTPIYASRSGVVTVATRSSTAGYYVTINHGDGFSTVYMHMTHYTVREGQRVTAGQKIGECGNTGASKGNHLHFGVYLNGRSVNPANYIRFY